MNEPKEALSAQALALIAEEEALLGRVHSALQAVAVRQQALRGQPRSALLERLTELRDEASTAIESDLPALFQQIDNTRAIDHGLFRFVWLLYMNLLHTSRAACLF